MEQQSMFYIKDEALVHAAQIIAIIENRGLKVTELYKATINLPLFWKLYNHVIEPYFTAIKLQLLNKTCVVGVVSGDDAVARMVDVAGRENYAEDNAPGTIRFLFGARREGFKHLNAIHRPKTAEEAALHLQAFKEFGGIRPMQIHQVAF